jgi:hypothetical protein
VLHTLAAALPGLLAAFDGELGDDLSHPALLLMFLDPGDGDGFELAVKQLPPGRHPLSELFGFVVPDNCNAIGAITHGWGSRESFDTGGRPSQASDRFRIRAVHVVCRNGDEVSGFRREGEQLEFHRGGQGMVPDALKRAIGLPTSPPDFGPPPPYATWSDARWAVVTGAWHLPDLSPTDAAWMDDGIFARWVGGSYP